MLPEQDKVRLRHILEASRQAFAFLGNKKRQDFDADQQLQFALIRCIEVIGEAAAHVSDECRCHCSDIPWAKIVATRNRLIHAYFDINLNVIWETCTDELPRLVRQLEAILASEDDRSHER